MTNKILQNPIVITGPTTINKTRIALILAKKLNGEIVNCDRHTFYRFNRAARELKDQTDKNSIYHLYGILKQNEPSWNSNKYAKEVEKICLSIIKRGKLPIIEGFSGKYLDALIELNKKQKRKFFYSPIIGLYFPKNIDIIEKLKKRLDKGFKEGLLEEAKKILLGKSDDSFASSQSVIYPNLLAHLKHKISLDEAKGRIIDDTLISLLPAQLITFDRMPQIEWIESGSEAEVIKEIIKTIKNQDNLNEDSSFRKKYWKDVRNSQIKLIRDAIYSRGVSSKKCINMMKSKLESLPENLTKKQINMYLSKIKKEFF